ncbi:MAG: hypothetical protein CL946_01185 [Ectothiorhodospiraceae bacterium]|nr:hypothetical protein [Ectothiorhodospiraceae bacterium]
MLKDFNTLRNEMSKERRERLDREAEELHRRYLVLRELLEAGEISSEQAELIAWLEPHEVSKLLSKGDMTVGTLGRIINAMGGDLRITARFGDKEEELYRSNAAD